MARKHLGEDELVLLPLGGAGEIGMNFNAYGFGPPEHRKWIVVDCGVLFGREAATPGIDLILPDISWLAEHKRDVLGIIATHAHEDHIGAIPHLWPQLRCPIYATPFTARLIVGKLVEVGLEDTARVNVLPLSGKLTLGPFDMELVSITHSILEPNALAIRTPLGTVVHTGDWKLDPDPLLGEVTDENALRKLGDEGVLALVCDSTNALVEGTSGSEASVRESLTQLIGTLKKRVAVTAFASNVARLDTIAKAAKAHGRRPVLVGRAMHKIVAAAKETGYLKDFPQTLDEQEAEDYGADRLLYLVTGSQGEPRAALARIANGKHPYVTLGEGDAVIYSSRVIPGNEIAIFEIQNKLAAAGVEILTDSDHFVHVSGHPCREELSEMYRWTRPRIAVPVHGERRHQEAHAALALSLQVPEAPVIENGQMLRLAPGKAEIVDETPAGRVHMDGRIMTDSGDDALRRRKAMAFAGLIVATLALDERGRIVGEPALLLEGVPEAAHEKLYQTLDSEVQRYRPRKGDDDGLKEVLRRALRRTAQDIWGKKPVTRVEIIWV